MAQLIAMVDGYKSVAVSQSDKDEFVMDIVLVAINFLCSGIDLSLIATAA